MIPILSLVQKQPEIHVGGAWHTDVFCKLSSDRWLALLSVSCSITLCYLSLESHHGHGTYSRISGVCEIMACYLCVCLFCLFILFFKSILAVYNIMVWPEWVPSPWLLHLVLLTSLNLSLFSHKDRMFYAHSEFFSYLNMESTILQGLQTSMCAQGYALCCLCYQWAGKVDTKAYYHFCGQTEHFFCFLPQKDLILIFQLISISIDFLQVFH